MISKISGYVENFDETKCLFFMKEDRKLLKNIIEFAE